eukprot:CAMPEP_0201594406 /NCGR_PEP_ID=MMETSP0190_2-20130828/191736_1 /ASSEMBLY_ACC=CAM_ASM_000263 /TAXON_ID=37353 /ORGANISM="Rosalina sp." /LENGTH=315 /DNA_ID=CAMNT_0048054013 /DNA_START=604 /DNA_END=1551 /DNA_ORIENTATION=-
MIVFIVDCALVSSCNFAMLKESQAFLMKQFKAVCPCLCNKGRAEKDMKVITGADKYDVYGSKTDATYTGTTKTYACSAQSQYESGNIGSVHGHNQRRPTVESTNIEMPSVNPGENGVGRVRIPSDSNHHINVNKNSGHRVSGVTAIEEEAFDLAEMVMKEKTMHSANLEDIMDIDAVLDNVKTLHGDTYITDHESDSNSNSKSEHENEASNKDPDHDQDIDMSSDEDSIDPEEALDLAEMVMNQKSISSIQRNTKSNPSTITTGMDKHKSSNSNSNESNPSQDQSLEEVNTGTELTPSTEENTAPQFEVVVSNKL